MSTLDSLPNPISRIPVLNSDGSASVFVKSSPLDNSVDWIPELQYFVGDTVRSPLDGFLYTYQGGALQDPPAPPPNTDTGPIVSKRGGSDPSESSYDVGGDWVRSAPYSGLWDTLTPTIADGGSGVWTVTNGVMDLPLAPSAVYMAVIQGTSTKGTALLSADWSKITLTPNGTGAVAVATNVVPIVDTVELSVSFAQSLVFSTGTGIGPFTLTLSGEYGGLTFVPTTLSVTVVRLS